MASIGGNGKLALTGESAGANLAAISALKARDAGGPEICLQLLAYPVIDHDFARASYLANGEDYLLTSDSMRWFWDLYCPDIGARNQPDACPIYAASLNDLPPAFVMTAEFDPLRDEGKAYADALSAAGVTTRYRCFDGLIHDFLATAPMFECSRVAFDEACLALHQAFEAA
jgi:acetyl esterase